MKRRGPIAIIALSLITFGIYALVWHVKTKGEMNAKGAGIPTAWMLIVPLVNIYWIWLYSGGVEKVTNEKLNQIIAFLLLFLVGPVGMAIVQESFNKVGGDVSKGEQVQAEE